jgi:hypothetical protein
MMGLYLSAAWKMMIRKERKKGTAFHNWAVVEQGNDVTLDGRNNDVEDKARIGIIGTSVIGLTL